MVGVIGVKKLVLPAIVAIAMVSGAANALTMTAESCMTSSVQGSTACAGVFDGNDSNSDLDGLFGFTGWTEVLKLNSSSGMQSGNGVELTVTNTGSGGTWSIDTYGGYDPVMFVTKGGPTFSAFLMDLTTLTGSWDTLSMLKGNGSRGAGLSHWTIYQAGTGGGGGQPPGGTAPVPLPAALWLLAGSVGALSFIRRRKS